MGGGRQPGLASRRAALRAVEAVERGGAYSTAAVPDAVADLGDERDRSLASHLAYDTLRWRGTLDWALGEVLDRPMEQVEGALRPLLRLGALQILRTRVPARAAVSTAVDLARERVPDHRAGGAAGFVNGVLRALARRAEDLPWPDAEQDPVAHLALTTAHPDWIVRELLDRHDREETARLLTADNDPPGLTLRATRDRDALVAELREAGLPVTPAPLAADGVRVPGADPRRLEAVRAGRAVPQDEASMLVVEAAGASAGETVLDLCAGPGGKTTHLARLVGEEGRVVAVERHVHRARRVAEAAAAQGRTVQVVAADSTRLPLSASHRFDLVLVDAPCSGLGTGRRRPEIRWRRTPGDVADLAALQRSLLSVGLDRARPGGRVVYAVCTWTRQETTGVVEEVVRPRSDVRRAGERQLLPHRHDTDGMYWAVLVTDRSDAV